MGKIFRYLMYNSPSVFFSIIGGHYLDNPIGYAVGFLFGLLVGVFFELATRYYQIQIFKEYETNRALMDKYIEYKKENPYN